jgi:hypothetical protein
MAPWIADAFHHDSIRKLYLLTMAVKNVSTPPCGKEQLGSISRRVLGANVRSETEDMLLWQATMLQIRRRSSGGKQSAVQSF